MQGSKNQFHVVRDFGEGPVLTNLSRTYITQLKLVTRFYYIHVVLTEKGVLQYDQTTSSDCISIVTYQSGVDCTKKEPLIFLKI